MIVFPFILKIVFGCVPGGIFNLTSPDIVGTLIVLPNTASTGLIFNLYPISVPRLSNLLSSFMFITTNKSPFGPLLGPESP